MRTIIIYLIAISIAAFVLPLQAGPLTVPNTFSSGTPAVAEEVNSNFVAVKTAVGDNDSRITDNFNDVTSNISRLDILESFGSPVGPILCTGLSFVQEIDEFGNAVCSTNLLGTGYSRRFPQVIDNLVTLEVAGLVIVDPVLMISGTGWDIERIGGFDSLGRPKDTSGFAMEHDFVIEVGGTDAIELKTYFDAPKGGFRAMSVIVKATGGAEAFRINLFEYDPFGYVTSRDGRTRFTFVQSTPPDNTAQVLEANNFDPFDLFGANNPATDTLTEIAGITGISFYPQVEIDEVNRTMTLTYPIAEGGGIWGWALNNLIGINDKRSGSVIQVENGFEVSRENYFGMFPITWEIFDGFGLYDKIQARVVISFDFHEPG